MLIMRCLGDETVLRRRWNIKLLARSCSCLCHATLRDANDDDVRVLAEHCRLLTHLDMHQCPKVTDVGVLALARHCSALSALWLCNDAVNYSSDSITDVSLFALGRSCPQLRELYIDRVRRWSPSTRTQVTDFGVAALTQLTHLEVSRLPLTGMGIEVVAAHGQLRYLNVSHCDQLQDRTIVAVARGCTSLREVNIKGCAALTDISVVALVTNCKNLTHLTVWGRNLTDDAAVAIAKHCANVHTLAFTSPNLTSVTQLTNRCTRLRSLSLTTDRLVDLGDDPRCIELEHLSIDCRSLRNDGVETLFQRCPLLHTVHLVRTRFLTDMSIVKLVQSSPMLRSIKLVGMPFLSNTSVYEIAHHCPRLEQLRLGFCQNVTDAPIDTLVVACVHLREVQMWYCERTSYPNVLDHARRKCKSSTRWLPHLLYFY